MYESDERQEFYCVGPLTLCRQTKQACTVMGTELMLETKTFYALYLLATQEDKNLSLNQLAAEIWDGDSDAAFPALTRLAEQVNSGGQGFMQITYTENMGYSFQTHWTNRSQNQRKPKEN